MLLTEDELREVILARAKDGRISCAEAIEIARETKTPTRKMGALLDEMGVRITNCQLGCFE